MIVSGVEVTSDILTKRGINQISKLANKRVAFGHGVEILPRHFEVNSDTAPGGAYGYNSRQRGYTIQKAKKFGHRKPLVFSGDLRDAVLGSFKVTATAKRATLKARGTRESQASQQFKNEIEAVTRKENQDHTAAWVDTFATLALSSRYRKKSRKKA